ncbi:hypothetical protein ACKLNR_013317 [Fusarium oxysporum f. sp. zingiberi]
MESHDTHDAGAGSSADSASTRHIVKHDVYAMQHGPQFSKVGHASVQHVWISIRARLFAGYQVAQTVAADDALA